MAIRFPKLALELFLIKKEAESSTDITRQLMKWPEILRSYDIDFWLAAATKEARDNPCGQVSETLMKLPPIFYSTDKGTWLSTRKPEKAQAKANRVCQKQNVTSEAKAIVDTTRLHAWIQPNQTKADLRAPCQGNPLNLWLQEQKPSSPSPVFDSTPPKNHSKSYDNNQMWLAKSQISSNVENREKDMRLLRPEKTSTTCSVGRICDKSSNTWLSGDRQGKSANVCGMENNPWPLTSSSNSQFNEETWTPFSPRSSITDSWLSNSSKAGETFASQFLRTNCAPAKNLWLAPCAKSSFEESMWLLKPKEASTQSENGIGEGSESMSSPNTLTECSNANAKSSFNSSMWLLRPKEASTQSFGSLAAENGIGEGSKSMSSHMPITECSSDIKSSFDPSMWLFRPKEASKQSFESPSEKGPNVSWSSMDKSMTSSMPLSERSSVISQWISGDSVSEGSIITLDEVERLEDVDFLDDGVLVDKAELEKWLLPN